MRRLRVRTGLLLLWLYPQSWRARYRAEVSALLEDDPPTPVELAGLVWAAAGAHLRPRAPWRERPRGERRALNSLTGLFACWIALSVAGIAFQKETEDAPYASAERHHALLAVAHDLVIAGALLGALAIACGGLPLLAQAVRRAIDTSDRALAALLLAPVAAVGQFALVSAVLFALAPADVGGASLGVRLAVLIPWYASGLLVAATAALAPRAVLARAEPDLRTLRRAALAGRVTTAGMGLVTLGLLAYGIGLWREEPILSGESGGPISPATGAVLILAGVLAASALLGALVAQVRARGALRAG